MFDRLMEKNIHGLPAAFVLFTIELCNGQCYDRALAMAYAFDDCRVVHGDQWLTTKQTGAARFSEHAWVETVDEAGDDWVVDTSSGLIKRREIYYELDNPKVNRVLEKPRINQLYTDKRIWNDDHPQGIKRAELLAEFSKFLANSTHPATQIYRNHMQKHLAEMTN